MTILDNIRNLRAHHQSGTITEEEVVDRVWDIAYTSGARGEAEEAFAILAYEYITGKEFETDKWS